VKPFPNHLKEEEKEEEGKDEEEEEEKAFTTLFSWSWDMRRKVFSLVGYYSDTHYPVSLLAQWLTCLLKCQPGCRGFISAPPVPPSQLGYNEYTDYTLSV